MFGVPRLEPRPYAALKLFHDAIGDGGVDVGPGRVVRSRSHLKNPPSEIAKAPLRKKRPRFSEQGGRMPEKQGEERQGRPRGGAPGLHAAQRRKIGEGA